MELREFVSDVLVQIAQGIKQADENVGLAGGIASPAVRRTMPGAAGDAHFTTLDNGAPVFLVKFDVAVTVSNTGEQSGGGRLTVASIFSAGLEGKSTDAASTVSRVQFQVPLALPVNEETERKVHEARKRQNEAIAAANNQRTQGGWMSG